MGYKIYSGLLPFLHSHLSRLDQPYWPLLLSLDLLTREKSTNKVSDVSLHPSPVILAVKIMVLLLAAMMHRKMGAMKLLEDLLSQIH